MNSGPVHKRETLGSFSRRLAAFLPLLLCPFVTMSLSDAAVTRDISVGSAPVVQGKTLYANSWAAVIGINRYRHPALKFLDAAVGDAQRVRAALLRLGFPANQVFTLTEGQATKAAIENLLADRLRRLAQPEDRVVVYFAGHGTTEKLRGDVEEGYLLPVDADPENLFATAISMTALKQIAARQRAKHVLFAVDACYSGYAIYKTRGITNPALVEELTRRPAIQILTAGRAGDLAQERDGQGLFTKVLLAGLEGQADQRGWGWVSLNQLGEYVQARVFAESDKRQLPQYGNLEGEGQFVFVLPQARAPDAGPTPDPRARLEEERRKLEEEKQNLEAERKALDEQRRLKEEQERLAAERARLEEERKRLEEERRKAQQTYIPPTPVPPPVTTRPETTSRTIKIATQSPLSGGQSALGEAIKLGAQLAIEREKGAFERLGFKLELVPYDDQAKPDVGVANARNIVGDPEILVVIGHLNSGVSIPSSEIYKDVSLAMVSPANTNPLVTDRKYANVNRVIGRDDVQGQIAARFAREELRVSTAFVIHDRTRYGQGVAELFRQHAAQIGLEIVGYEGTEEKRDFSEILARVAATNPEVVYFGGIYDQAGQFLAQMRARGISQPAFLGPDGFDSSDLAKIAGRSARGIHYTTTAVPPTLYPGAKAFVEEYRSRFGKRPEPYAAEAYDATVVALKAIENVIQEQGGRKPSRAQVSQAIRRTTGFQGVTGPVEFDEKGDRRLATYYVIRVESDDPARWGYNQLVKRLQANPPSR